MIRVQEISFDDHLVGLLILCYGDLIGLVFSSPLR